MSAKQWLAITLIVILNIVIFGALLERRAAQPVEPTPSRTPIATFTPMPFPTATLETIAMVYGVEVDALAEANDLSMPVELKPGDQLVIPVGE